MKLTFQRTLPLASLVLLSQLALVGCGPKDADTANSGNMSGGDNSVATTAPGQAAENAANSAGNAVGNAANSAGNAVGNAADKVTNAGVTAKIKNALIMSTVLGGAGKKLNVNTTDTEVMVMGTVPTAAAHAEAIKLAKANAGTRKVVDHLEVKK